ncbi:MAG: type II toxin-antitoxin system RelE/ParE family toxin [Planctomycetota bacterium]
MTYSVIVTQKAKDDLRHYFSVAREHAPQTAARWLNRFEEALQTLSDNPTRCALAPENDLVDAPSGGTG